MVPSWENLMAAHQHAPSTCTEGHSVSKCDGAQIRDEHDRVLLTQKAILNLGKSLLHLNGDNLRTRSERNESHWYLGESSGDFNSEQFFCRKT